MVLVCWGWFLVVRGQVEGNNNGWDGFWLKEGEEEEIILVVDGCKMVRRRKP